jgi:nitrate reductase cytochrome c-type subunit
MIRTVRAAVVLGAMLALAIVPVASGVAQPASSTSKSPRARMYQGAPPTVPHDVEGRKAICQECHATGANDAPLAPHPTRTHFCIACHVPQDASAKPLVSPIQPR